MLSPGSACHQDHWNGNSSNPGVFEVYYSLDGGSTFNFIASVADDASPSLSFYSLTFSTGLTAPVGPFIGQVVYKTNNPSAPAAFYQCFDGFGLSY